MTSWLRNVFYLRILHKLSALWEIVHKISAISMNSSHHVVTVFEDDDYLRFTCRSYFRSRFDVTCSEGKHDCSSHQRKNMGLFPWGAGHVESPCALSRNGNRLERSDRIRIASQAPTLLDPTANRNSFRQLQFFSRVRTVFQQGVRARLRVDRVHAESPTGCETRDVRNGLPAVSRGSGA